MIPFCWRRTSADLLFGLVLQENQNERFSVVPSFPTKRKDDFECCWSFQWIESSATIRENIQNSLSKSLISSLFSSSIWSHICSEIWLKIFELFRVIFVVFLCPHCITSTNNYISSRRIFLSFSFIQTVKEQNNREFSDKNTSFCLCTAKKISPSSPREIHRGWRSQVIIWQKFII